MTTKQDVAPARSQATNSWAGVLDENLLKKQRAFFDVRVKHPMMERLLDDLMPLLTPNSESHIIVIVGAPGVGKSTLFRVLLKTLFEQFSQVVENDQTIVPLVSVEARADGDGKPGFETLYEEMLQVLNEPDADKKVCIEVRDGKMVNRAQAKGHVKALRNAVGQALTKRRTKVCVIDEAAHLLRFAKEAAVMETFKSLSNTTNLKWVLVGSFDLFDLIEENGQIARRAEVLSLDRYHLDDPEDRKAFTEVVRKLQAKWPCEEVPNFVRISDELLEVSLGCVGLLKTLMLEACALQLHNNGKWSGSFLRKAAKSNKLLAVIRKEIEAGEIKVRDALHGDCLWDEKAYAELTRRMEPANV